MNLQQLRHAASKARADYIAMRDHALARLKPNEGLLECAHCDNVYIVTFADLEDLRLRQGGIRCSCSPGVGQRVQSPHLAPACDCGRAPWQVHTSGCAVMTGARR